MKTKIIMQTRTSPFDKYMHFLGPLEKRLYFLPLDRMFMANNYF